MIGYIGILYDEKEQLHEWVEVDHVRRVRELPKGRLPMRSEVYLDGGDTIDSPMKAHEILEELVRLCDYVQVCGFAAGFKS